MKRESLIHTYYLLNGSLQGSKISDRGRREHAFQARRIFDKEIINLWLFLRGGRGEIIQLIASQSSLCRKYKGTIIC